MSKITQNRLRRLVLLFANLVLFGKEPHVGRLRRLPRQRRAAGRRRRRRHLAPRRGRVLHATNASAMIDRRCDFKAF